MKFKVFFLVLVLFLSVPVLAGTADNNQNLIKAIQSCNYEQARLLIISISFSGEYVDYSQALEEAKKAECSNEIIDMIEKAIKSHKRRKMTINLNNKEKIVFLFVVVSFAGIGTFFYKRSRF